MNQQRRPSPHQRRGAAATAPAPRPADQQQQGGQQLARAEGSAKLSTLPGTYRAAADVNNRMEWAQRNAHLISPATSVGAMPEGCSVAMTIVTVDAANDTYDVGMGKRGLSKSVLQQLGAALGISWDPSACGRIDDGSDPYYCRWRAIGTYRSFDGQLAVLHAEKELDLRDGSPTCVALEEQQRSKGKSADRQIREMRQHIQSHAETKAQLRAIRSLGIKTAYTAAELQKPFVAARIMFTGQTDDPELRRMFAEKTADSFLGGSRALYGQPPAAPALPGAPRATRLPPPPVGSVKADDDDYADGSSGAGHDAGGAPGARGPRGGWTIPGGRSKGTPLAEAERSDLEYWADRIGKAIDAGTSHDADRDTALYNALCDEIGRREGDNAVAESPADGGDQGPAGQEEMKL